MWLSNTKLNLILSDPGSYYLKYKIGLDLKVKKPALTIGSDVHWGIEHNTSDLSELYGKTIKDYTQNQILAECMDNCYLVNKDDIFNDILENGKYTLVSEDHEVTIYAKLKSFRYNYPHTFMGIIDLLLLVQDENGNYGFIIIDYKTSSSEPDWNTYLDQLYRYIFIVHDKAPELPVFKIGIINLIKSKVHQKADESNEDFKKRLLDVYSMKESKYIKYHCFEPSGLDEEKLNSYIYNLSLQADLAQAIDESGSFPINYKEINGVYGRGDFADIFEGIANPDMYEIKDIIYDPNGITEVLNEDGQVETIQGIMSFKRNARKIDMECFFNKKILNKYDNFVELCKKLFGGNIPPSDLLTDDIKNQVFDAIKSNRDCDDYLLDLYWINLKHYQIVEERKKEEYAYV